MPVAHPRHRGFSLLPALLPVLAATPAWAAVPGGDDRPDPTPWSWDTAQPEPAGQDRFDKPLYLALAPPADDWRGEAVVWLWLVGMNGDVGAKGHTADVSATFLDIAEASDSLFAVSGRFEVGKGRWGLFLDGMYSNLGADDQTGPAGRADVDVTFQMAVIDFGVSFRLTEWGAGPDPARRGSLDLYAGGRYAGVDSELDPRLLEARSQSESWLDPIVGAKVVLPLSQRWCLVANGDVGGFGVGSDFTWSATGVVGYDFTLFNLPTTLYAGYRAIGTDFTDGSGPDEFTWDTILHGPILGMGVRF